MQFGPQWHDCSGHYIQRLHPTTNVGGGANDADDGVGDGRLNWSAAFDCNPTLGSIGSADVRRCSIFSFAKAQRKG